MNKLMILHFILYDSIQINSFDNYFLKVGILILQNNEENLLGILFSTETPKLFINIIMICFEYIRQMHKDVSDFINLCIPSLNHINFLYLLIH